MAWGFESLHPHHFSNIYTNEICRFVPRGGLNLSCVSKSNASRPKMSGATGFAWVMLLLLAV